MPACFAFAILASTQPRPESLRRIKRKSLRLATTLRK